MRTAGNLSGLRVVITSLVVLDCVAPSASADLGVPMLAFVWPASWLLLVPIILIEAWAAVRMLGIGFALGLKLSARVNVITTLIGIPATWAILLGLEIVTFMLVHLGGSEAMKQDKWFDGIALVTLHSPWMFVEQEKVLTWMIPTAAAFLCIPFFLMSVAIEDEAARRFLRDRDAKAIRRWAWWANGLTYALIWIGLGIGVYRAL